MISFFRENPKKGFSLTDCCITIKVFNNRFFERIIFVLIIAWKYECKKRKFVSKCFSIFEM